MAWLGTSTDLGCDRLGAERVRLLAAYATRLSEAGS